MIVRDHPEKTEIKDLLDRVLSVRPDDFPDIDRQVRTFGLFDTDLDGRLRAGSFVYLHPGWAYIDIVWVREDCRGTGQGRALVSQTEEEAVKRGAHSAYLWTQDFEAPGFYEKLGYKRFVVMEDFIPGHQRIGFMKKLMKGRAA
ncbi:MAG: GNAT family N-acetyltransferase [Alphaproteobacteria bacterium]|nr:GNAT family N-acetyltransferase [Alphaproteobacteria bacterium]